MISLLISLIVLAVVVWLVFLALDYIGVPEPFGKIIKVIIVVIAIIYALNAFSPFLKL